MAFHDIEKLIELREGVQSSKARIVIYEEIGLGMKADRMQNSAEWANNFEISDKHSKSAKRTLEAARVAVTSLK